MPTLSEDCGSTRSLRTPTRWSTEKILVTSRAASGQVSYCRSSPAMRARTFMIQVDLPRRTVRRSRVHREDRGQHMAMTAQVKDELSRVPVSKTSERKAELATMLRFAGALHLIGGHIVIEAELDTGSVARR